MLDELPKAIAESGDGATGPFPYTACEIVLPARTNLSYGA